MTNREQQEKLFRAIGFVGDDLIQRADAPVEARRPNAAWVKWAALAACCVLVISLASRLPLLGAKTGNTAPETASMMLDSTTATTEAKSEAPQMTEETAAEEAPAEAEEAPAEAPAEEARAGEAGSGPRNDTEAECAGAVYDAELAQELLDTTLGPVKLGMPSADVRSILGAPKEDRGEFYVCTDKGDYRYATWAYNLSNDPDYICDVLLRFADVGDGLVLDEIMTFGTSDWALPTGIRDGSSADDVLAAYPDAELTYSGEGADGSPAGTISLQTGHVRLTFLVEGEKVTSITLGTYYAESGVELETEK